MDAHPKTLPASNQARPSQRAYHIFRGKVKITDTSDATVYDESNNDFTIKGALTLDTPDGGEEWVAGTPSNITWQSNVDKVNIDYSINNGIAWTSIIFKRL